MESPSSVTLKELMYDVDVLLDPLRAADTRIELWHSHPDSLLERSSTDFLLCSFVLQSCSTKYLGHGHGYECHSPM